MDIFEFAMEKEQFAEQYYRKLAESAPHKGLVSIFTMLADEEHTHYEVILKMKEGVPSEIADTILLTNAKTIFAKIRHSREKFKFGDTQIDAYKKAREIEQDSRAFYRQKANEAQDPRQKAIFNTLAEEENKHYFLLDNIIEFVSRPKTWLENAEFHHLEQYLLIVLRGLTMKRDMKRKLVLTIVLLTVAVVTPVVYSHCQMPCGIYDDQARFTTIAEDCSTIEKAMKSITELSADSKTNMNQLVRWVNTKEEHAESIAYIISFYFMSQRVAPVNKSNNAAYDKYIKQITLLHEMLIVSMKCKQTTDPTNVLKLRSLLSEFKKAYLGE